MSDLEETTTIRLEILSERHLSSLERFLKDNAESSMILRSNSLLAGLTDKGHILEGTYAAFMDGEDVTGVAAVYWNGMAFLQAPDHAGTLVRAAARVAGRDLCGLAGPYDQLIGVLDDLGIGKDSWVKTGKERLYSLDLDFLEIPGLLADNPAGCRHPLTGELPVLCQWRMDYCRECLHQAPGESLERETREIIPRLSKDRNLWVLESDGALVATSAFNAVLPDMVQVGGVYTPPGFRNNGYARSVVAGSLLEAKKRGVGRAILFTGTEMTAAIRCYESLGFAPIGDYGLAILKEPLRP